MQIDEAIAYLEKLAEHIRGELACAQSLLLGEASDDWKRIEMLQSRVSSVDGAIIMLRLAKEELGDGIHLQTVESVFAQLGLTEVPKEERRN